MKFFITLSMASLLTLPAWGAMQTDQAPSDGPGDTNTTREFAPHDNYEEGFLTHYLNKAIADGMTKVDETQQATVGRNLTDLVSPPTFGGYVMSGYYYSSKDGSHKGDGFKQKNARLYVKGSILKDFNYLVQVQFTNDKFHMKDYYLEWAKYKEFQVKAGQFIRAFGYECPYNPFEFYDHSYAQLSQKLCGQADRVSEDKGGGRDQGIQIQGDLFPASDGHRLLHYQVMLSNGQTINSADKNAHKDISGCIAIQPIAGLRLAAWGWTGNFTGSNGVTVGRDRYLLSVFYEKNDWTIRSEYAHSTGGKLDDVTNKKAQGWYATVGVPCNNWLKTYFKYDAYEDDATSNSLRTIYSVAPHIALHKNLYFLPSVGYVTEKTATGGTTNYVEVFAEMAFRF